MKYPILLAAGAAFALTACQSEEASEAAPAETAEAAEPVAAAETAAAPAGSAAFTAGQPPSKEFVAGIWGEGDECELAINFQPDGTIKDGPFDTWAMEGGQLVMGGEVKLKLTVVDADTMESQPEGSTETSTLKRCG